MKKTWYLLIVGVLLAGCSAWDTVDCSCGRITEKGGNYIIVRNSCSGSLDVYYLNPYDWRYSAIGGTWCGYYSY
jgi:hypothetical protein